MVKRLIPLIFLLLLTGTAHATATLVQTHTCTWTSGPTFTCAFTNPTVAGNTLVFISAVRNSAGSAGSVNSVTDAAGNTWSVDTGNSTTHLRIDGGHSSPAKRLSGNITFTISGTVTSAGAYVEEWSNMLGVAAVGSPFDSGSSATVTTGLFNPFIDTTQSLFIGGFLQESSNTYSGATYEGGGVPSTWTLIDSGLATGGLALGTDYSLFASLSGPLNYGSQATASGSAAYVGAGLVLNYSNSPQSECVKGQACDATTSQVVRSGITDFGYTKNTTVNCPGSTSRCNVALGDDQVLIMADPPSTNVNGSVEGQELTIHEIQVGNALCKHSSYPYSCCNGQATTLASQITLPVTPIPLTSGSGFTASGSIVINDTQVVAYSGKSTNNLTGATGGFGTIPAGATVYQYNTGGCESGITTHGWWSPPTTNIAASKCVAAGTGPNGHVWPCCTGAGTGPTCLTGSWSPDFGFLGSGNATGTGTRPVVPTIQTDYAEDLIFSWDPNSTFNNPNGTWVFKSRTLNQPYGISCQGGGISKGNHPGNSGSVADFALPANTYTAILGDNGGFFGGNAAGQGGVNVFTNHTINTIQVHNPNPIGGWITFECTCGANQDSLCPPPDPIWVPAGGSVPWTAGTEFGNSDANVNFGSQQCGANPTLVMTATWNSTFNCPIPSN